MKSLLVVVIGQLWIITGLLFGIMEQQNATRLGESPGGALIAVSLSLIFGGMIVCLGPLLWWFSDDVREEKA